MILIDTSAWIDFFRGRDPIASRVEQYLEDNRAAYCRPVLTEIRRGLKSAKEQNMVLPLIEGSQFLSQPDSLWEDAGEIGFLVRRHGHTVKTIDLLIACYTIAHSTPLLALDRAFAIIAKAGLGLDLI